MPNAHTVTYEYDANGLRTKKVEPGPATKYLLDGPSVFADLDGSNAVTTRYLTNLQVIDEIDSFTQGGGTYYPLTDVLGSIYAIADGNGTVVSTSTYDVYGERTTSGTGPALAFGFDGREHDSVAGLNYHRDRYFDFQVGRWSQPDRLRVVAGVNAYRFSESNPVSKTDSSGMIVDLPEDPRSGASSALARLTNLQRLYDAVDLAINGAVVGLRLFGQLSGVMQRIRFRTSRLGGGGVMGATHPVPRTVSMGCSTATVHDIEIAIDYDEADKVNSDFTTSRIQMTFSDVELVVHEMRHAANFVDGSIVTLPPAAEERTAWDAQNQARIELGYNVMDIGANVKAYGYYGHCHCFGCVFGVF